jgi:hypothetical protein
MRDHASPIQEAIVLDHLIRIGPITPLEALNHYGIFRLAARIFRLREAGHDIYTEIVKNEHTGKRYARYHLIAQAKAAA